eukprot:3161645-Heterocapsa_arctica.AAC.1
MDDHIGARGDRLGASESPSQVVKGAGKCLPRPRARARLQVGESGALANPTRRGGIMTKSPAVSVEPPRENALHGVDGRRASKGDHACGVAAHACGAKHASQHL